MLRVSEVFAVKCVLRDCLKAAKQFCCGWRQFFACSAAKEAAEMCPVIFPSHKHMETTLAHLTRDANFLSRKLNFNLGGPSNCISAEVLISAC